MISAVIFDCFGVLLTDNWLSFKQEKFGDDPVLLERVSEINHMVDAGLISDSNYIAEIASMAHMSVPEIEKIFHGVSPNQPVVDLAKELKKHYKIGLLSNVSDDWFEALFKPEELALFDSITLSYKVGVTKPDPRIYHIAAEQLGAPIEHCIFIDDVEQNITAAIEQGMQGIVYTTMLNLTQDLATQTVIVK